MLPAAPGSYALVLACRSGGRARIGSRGELEVPPGWYVYSGSALGPGGLRARVGRHLRAAVRPHWHIDFLRALAEVRTVWYTAGAVRREHKWAARIAALPGASVPMPGFGSSDCRCKAHLIYFADRPSRAVFEAALGRSAREWRRA